MAHGSLLGSDSKTGQVMQNLETVPILDPKRIRKRAITIQIALSVIANITVFSSGMGLGYPAIAIKGMTKENDPMRFNNDQISWFASINTLFCPLGGLLSATLLDKIGRKNTFVCINIFSIVSWTLMALSSKTNFEVMYWQVFISRCLIGITTGLSSSPAAIYSAEIAHPKIRGRLTLLTSLAIAIGILLVYTFGFLFPDNWRLVSGICCAISMISMLLLIFIPDSPIYQISKNKTEMARNSLCLIRGYPKDSMMVNPMLNKEIELLSDQIMARNNRANESMIETLSKPEFHKPLFIIVGFFFFQQVSGIFAVIVYASKFAVEAGVTMDPFLCTVLIGLTRVVATILVFYVLDSVGRKKPAILSGLGMTVCMLCLSAFLKFPVLNQNPIFANWLPTLLLIGYIFTSTLGFLTIPFAILPELFNFRFRGMASGLTICCAYMMSFFVIKFYPTMLELMGNAFVFIFYGLISFIGVFYVYYIVPETKAKSLDEIENLFKKPRRDEENLSS